MYKNILLVLFVVSSHLYAENSFFEEKGVSVTMKDKKGKTYEITVKRNIPTECKKVLGVT